MKLRVTNHGPSVVHVSNEDGSDHFALPPGEARIIDDAGDIFIRASQRRPSTVTVCEWPAPDRDARAAPALRRQHARKLTR